MIKKILNLSALIAILLAGKLESQDSTPMAKTDTLSKLIFDGKQIYSLESIGLKYITVDGIKLEKVWKTKFNMADSPIEIQGKLAFRAAKFLGDWFIMYGDRTLGLQYDWVSAPMNINGKLAYLACKNENSDQILNYDGVEITGHETGNYDNYFTSVNYPLEVNGKLAYTVKIGRLSGPNILVYDGKEIGKQYDNVINPKDDNGKLVYTAIKNGKEIQVTEEFNPRRTIEKNISKKSK
ncbi:MAG: hypothetical protein WC755_01670 [Candidatus Woesearchaeota archaeon]|jgi:hypothetical protein